MSRETLRAGLPPLGAVDGQALGALAFGSSAGGASAVGRSLAFLPLEVLELDLSDPEQRDFGDYELLEQLGQGGMGVVYRAHQRSLDRDVALKLLAAGPWAAPAFIERFRAEAQSAARLRHPNIVPVYEFGSHAELNFFSMGLVEGESLDWRLAREGPLPGREAARLVRRVAEAVDYAHRLGILHLDLKPANILVEAHSGEPMVADFGLAKRLDATLSDTASDVSGTPSYMAPEQARGQPQGLGIATDVYGLGAVLYELLCGRPPFLGPTARETLRRVLEAPLEPPGALRERISPDLDAICLRCLARDPGERYLSARALADDLGRYLEGHPVSARPLSHWQRGLRWVRREPRVAALALATVLALGLGTLISGLQWLRAESAASELRVSLWQQRSDQAAARMNRGASLEALPELVANLAEQESAGVAAASALTRVRIGTALERAPHLVDVIGSGSFVQQVLVDPRGEWLAALTGSSGTAQLYGLRDGALRWKKRVVLGGHGTSLVASSDPRFLISQVVNYEFPVKRGYQNYLVDIASGDLVEPPADRFPGIFKRHFSPDASHAVIVLHDAEAGGAPRGRLVRVSDWAVLGPERILPGMAMMAPGGRHFAYRATLVEERGTPVAAELVDATTMQTIWSYQPERGAAMRAWHFMDGGTRLALGFEDGRVGVFDVEDGSARWLVSRSARALFDFFLSADGQWLAAVHEDGVVQLWDTRSGEPVMPPLRLADESGALAGASLELDPASRSLYSSDTGGGRFWTIQPGDGGAHHVESIPSHPGMQKGLATSAVLPLGLFASGASDGEIRVWRRRSQSPLQAEASPRSVWNAPRHFDGRHAVHVSGSTVQLRNLRGDAAGPRMDFPQSISQALALPDGRTVLAAVGSELHARDGRSGEAAWPPLKLAGTPSALLPSDDGRRALVATNAYSGERSWLQLHIVDTATGVVLGSNRLDHPSWQLRLAADGSAVMAARFDQLVLFDGERLAVRWEPRRLSEREASSPIRGMEMGRDGRVLWVSTGRGGADGYRIHAFDAASGRSLQRWVAPSWAASLQSLEHGRALVALLPNPGEVQLFRLGETAVRTLPLDLPGQGRTLVASEDGQRLLVLSELGLQWFGLPELDWLSPGIPAPGAETRFVDAVLDPGGQHAIVRDTERRLWRFGATPDGRSVDELRQLVQLLAPRFVQGRDPIAPAQPLALRAALRAADPGPPSGRPVLQPAASRLPAAERGEVDLRPYCNLPLGESQRHLFGQLQLDRVLPPGRHRLVDVGFHVSCAVLARYAPDQAPSLEAGSRVEGIALPDPHPAALELLLLGASRLLDPMQDAYGIVELVYRDGTRTRQEIKLGRDLEPWFYDDAQHRMHQQRVAYSSLAYRPDGAIGAPPHMSIPVLHALRVPNPHPERELVSIAIESTRHAWSTVLLLGLTSLPATPHPAPITTPDSTEPAR